MHSKIIKICEIILIVYLFLLFICILINLFVNSVPGEPQRVKLHSINSTTVTVSWQPPNDDELHGILRGYQVKYFATNDSDIPLSVPETINLTSAQTDLSIGHLQSNTLYAVQIAASTQPGLGEFSKIKKIRTRGSGNVCLSDDFYLYL